MGFHCQTIKCKFVETRLSLFHAQTRVYIFQDLPFPGFLFLTASMDKPSAFDFTLILTTLIKFITNPYDLMKYFTP